MQIEPYDPLQLDAKTDDKEMQAIAGKIPTLLKKVNRAPSSLLDELEKMVIWLNWQYRAGCISQGRLVQSSESHLT